MEEVNELNKERLKAETDILCNCLEDIRSKMSSNPSQDAYGHSYAVL